MRNEFFTDHTVCGGLPGRGAREMRKHNFTEVIDRHFALGAHLNARDRKAARKCVSGLMKVIYPNGETATEEMAEILEVA